MPGMNLEYNLEAKKAWRSLSESERAQAKRGKKNLLGYEKREGFTGELPFYLFWCDECEHESKDYPHGFVERQYLLCSNCGMRHDFVPWWVPFATCWSMVKVILKLMFGGYKPKKPSRR